MTRAIHYSKQYLVGHAVMMRCLLLCLLCTTWVVQAHADNPAPPAHIQQSLPQAKLSGEGSFRWFGLKIYDAKLWISDKGLNTADLHSTPFALNLRYARCLKGKKIADASSEQIQKLGLGSSQQRATWQVRMEQLFPDVEDGSNLTGLYLPNEGTHFFLDGKLLGTIADADFANAFFAIWLSPSTSAPQLRDALLLNTRPTR